MALIKSAYVKTKRPFYIFVGFCLLILCYGIEVHADQWKRVYLATFPRSGNHWTRYIIEEATHIATSSVYPDYDVPKPHLPTPFPWGGYCPDHGYKGNCRYPTINDIVVVKTHYPVASAQPFDLRPSIKTIHIIRHPVDSFYSFYLYINPNKKNQLMDNQSLNLYLNLWKKFQNYWNKRENVITVRYEDMLQEPHAYFQYILEEIGYKVTQADINRAVKQYPPQGYELKHLPFFTQEQLTLIQKELKDLMDEFNYIIPL